VPTNERPGGRGQLLLPWPNRLDDGRYTFDGITCRAPIDEPSRGNAIHGLLRWMPWTLLDRADEGVTLGCTLHPQPAYAWTLEIEVRYELVPTGLRVTMAAENRSASPAPFGAGAHPYVTVETDTIDDASLLIPADRRLVTDDRGLPTEGVDVSGTPFDFTRERVIEDLTLDTCFTSLARDGDGLARVTLATPPGDRRVRVWMDDAFPWVMVYSGDTVEPASRRRRGIAIEPMTCPPNALRTGIDVVTLAPGERWTGTWGIDPTDAGGTT